MSEPDFDEALIEQVVEPEPIIEDDIIEEEPEDTEEPLTEEEIVEEARRNSNLRMLLAKFITMAKELDAKNQKDEGTPT